MKIIASKAKSNSDIVQVLKDKFYNAALDVMTRPDFGWPKEEAKDYLFVDVDNVEDGYIEIQVRAEMSYGGMEKMADVLDPLVAEIDSDAYFDFDSPGIMVAYVEGKKALKSKSIIQGNEMIPGQGDYDPPEYDEPEEGEVIEYINVQLDDNIIIDEDGSWEYEDENYTWARPDKRSENWYSEEYSDVYLDDYSGVVEKVDDLMSDKLPDGPGKYHVKANVNLYYSITGIDIYSEYVGHDEDDSPIIDEEVYTDNADVLYVASESALEDFECNPVDVNAATSISPGITFDIPKPSTSARYDMYTSAQHRGVTFSIYYNSVDTSPEADPTEMFRTFKAQVRENHPYDDGNYLSARLENGVIYFAENGKAPKKKSFYLDADAMDVENYEWCSAVVEQAIIELRELNKSVSSRMMHN